MRIEWSPYIRSLPASHVSKSKKCMLCYATDAVSLHRCRMQCSYPALPYILPPPANLEYACGYSTYSKKEKKGPRVWSRVPTWVLLGLLCRWDGCYLAFFGTGTLGGREWVIYFLLWAFFAAPLFFFSRFESLDFWMTFSRYWSWKQYFFWTRFEYVLCRSAKSFFSLALTRRWISWGHFYLVSGVVRLAELVSTILCALFFVWGGIGCILVIKPGEGRVLRSTLNEA